MPVANLEYHSDNDVISKILTKFVKMPVTLRGLTIRSEAGSRKVYINFDAAMQDNVVDNLIKWALGTNRLEIIRILAPVVAKIPFIKKKKRRKIKKIVSAIDPIDIKIKKKKHLSEKYGWHIEARILFKTDFEKQDIGDFIDFCVDSCICLEHNQNKLSGYILYNDYSLYLNAVTLIKENNNVVADLNVNCSFPKEYIIDIFQSEVK